MDAERLIRFAKGVTADYAAEKLREQAQERVRSSAWAKQHPEWVARHAEISARTPQERKAAVTAGRRKVPMEKLTVPLRADPGTTEEPTKRRWYHLKSRRKRQQIAKYANENDYLSDRHAEENPGEMLELHHRPTHAWARKKYGSEEWWDRSVSERPKRGDGPYRPQRDPDLTNHRHPEHGYRYVRTTPQAQARDDEQSRRAVEQSAKRKAQRLARKQQVVKAADMRVLVSGARDWDDDEAVGRRLDKLGKRRRLTVIEGGAKGADAAAARWAQERGHAHEPYPADWKAHGRSAGPRRNQRMLDEGRPDLVLAFHRDLDSSKGTKDMVARSKKAGKPVVVYGEGGKPVRRKALAKADVVVPHAVEAKIRETGPPERHDALIEEAKDYYRREKEIRQAEARELRQPQQVAPQEQQPTKAQSEKMLARKRRKAPRKRKVIVYPANSSSKPQPPSTHAQGMWNRMLEAEAYAKKRDAERAASRTADDAKGVSVRKVLIPLA